MSASVKKQPAILGTIGFMIAAVICAGLAGVLLSNVLESKYSTEPVKPIVVAKQNLPSGEPIKAEALQVVDWPVSSVPAGAFHKVQEAVAHKGVPVVPLVRGEVVLRSHLSEPHAGIGIASLLEEGKRAMSIKTDDPVTLARLVYPGARVDVISTVQSLSGGLDEGPRSQARIVLQNVMVLAVGEDIDPMTIITRRRELKQDENQDKAFSQYQEDSKEVRGVVTLAVDPEEAELLALAAKEGKLDVVLRNPKDTQLASTQGKTSYALQAEIDEAELAARRGKSRSSARRGGRSYSGGSGPRSSANGSSGRRRSRKSYAKVENKEAPAVRIYRGK